MSKTIYNLIEKRVKDILNKDDVITEEDLKFLILYRNAQRISPLERLINDFKKIVGILNTPDDDKGDE